GDTNDREIIFLNGVLFKVTRNLYSALRHLRHTDRFRTLWINAICLYIDRYQTKYYRSLKFGSLLSEGLRFALVIYLLLSILPAYRLACSLSFLRILAIKYIHFTFIGLTLI
ncbi:hypothetical protein L207DRAFT_440454, partial [Hyaloscypha variabilis F]